MELSTLVATVETGQQDLVLKGLTLYNQETSQCFSFKNEDVETRKVLGTLLIQLLERDLQPPCQAVCLETIRILSRDKSCLGPFVTLSGLKMLARHAGIDCSSPQVAEPEVMVESLKCLCNLVFSSTEGQQRSAEAGIVVGLARRLKLHREGSFTHEVRFLHLRLMFLLTALRVDVRQQLARELQGVILMTDALQEILGVQWKDSYEVASDPRLLPRQAMELAMETLKVLFNITFDSNRQKTDKEDTAAFRHLGALLRYCLMLKGDDKDTTVEFHSHTVNLLGNLPFRCLDVLLSPKVRPGCIEYMGVNLDAPSMLLDFLEQSLDRGLKMKENLTPALNLLTQSAQVHQQTRRYLRAKVLPPLRDVKNRPEVGEHVRNKLVRLMTHMDTDVKHCAAEFLFVLCKENVTRFVKYTGYGNAAGLLAARGLMAGGRAGGNYSEDEDTDTEEYKEAKANINPVTGRVEEKPPNPLDGMTEEQKEDEAMKLVDMFTKLSRQQVIQPMAVGPDGKLTSLDGVMHRMAERSPSDSSSDMD
ncbi:synembryn-A [Ambystoma mexicanum]|uniref:synembryn-A n=1 Tax=Ambystoma mexicanum TaxID=8296 RepID=UPI0037E909FD